MMNRDLGCIAAVSLSLFRIPPQDKAKGMGLLEQLVAHGHGWACFVLGTLLLQEHNIPGGDAAQVARAFQLFHKAAEANVAPAMKNLSNLYELGVGTTKDAGKALEWLRKAAKSGDPSAQVGLLWGVVRYFVS